MRGARFRTAWSMKGVAETESLKRLEWVIRDAEGRRTWKGKVCRRRDMEKMLQVLDEERTAGEVGGHCYEVASKFIGVCCRDFQTAYVVIEESKEAGIPSTERMALGLLESAVLCRDKPAARIDIAFQLVESLSKLSPDFCEKCMKICRDARVNGDVLLDVFMRAYDAREPEDDDIEPLCMLVAGGLTQTTQITWFRKWLTTHQVPIHEDMAREFLVSAGKARSAAAIAETYNELLLPIVKTPSEIDYLYLFRAYIAAKSITGLEATLDNIDLTSAHISIHALRAMIAAATQLHDEFGLQVHDSIISRLEAKNLSLKCTNKVESKLPVWVY